MTPRVPAHGRTTAGGPSVTPTVLVVYYADRFPLRTALADHLFAIARYGDCTTIYLNIAIRSVPPWIRALQIDMVVYHTSLLAQRWHPPTFLKMRQKMDRLRLLPGVKVAIPQDEFIHTDLLCDFIREFHINHVMTCAAKSDQGTIYGDIAAGPVTFTQVLTGYLDPRTVARIEQLSRRVRRRPLDIAYRAWRPEFWLGRHAQLKGTIADAFESAAPKRGLDIDISVRDHDTLIGDAWFLLLLRARWTIGVEGGASVIDRDGSLRHRTIEYVAEHPGAAFAEVESACFPGLDGSLGLMAISPRHLEACATRTAQALVQGEYNGILEAGTHYLPINGDLSNVPDILSAMADDGLRDRLADRAYRDIVASGRYDYRTFADIVIETLGRGDPAHRGFAQRVLLRWEVSVDAPSWYWVAARQRLRPAVRSVLIRTGLRGLIQRIGLVVQGTERR